MYAILIGALTAPVSLFAARRLRTVGVDDRLECLPIHGLAGAVGTLLTGVFASTAEVRGCGRRGVAASGGSWLALGGASGGEEQSGCKRDSVLAEGRDVRPLPHSPTYFPPGPPSTLRAPPLTASSAATPRSWASRPRRCW